MKVTWEGGNDEKKRVREERRKKGKVRQERYREVRQSRKR
jgi:hypothetical protein